MSLKERILLLKSKYKTNFTRVKEYKKIKDEIHDQTSFLIECSEGERCYCIINDIKNKQLCEVCGNPVNFYKKIGYTRFCSTSCSSIGKQQPIFDDAVIEKRRTTRAKHRDQVIEKFKIYYESTSSVYDIDELKTLLRQKINKNKTFYIDRLYKERQLIKSILFHTHELPININELTEIIDLDLPIRVTSILNEHSLLCECGNQKVFYDGEIQKYCFECSHKYRDTSTVKNENTYKLLNDFFIQNGFSLNSTFDEYNKNHRSVYLTHHKCGTTFNRYVNGRSSILNHKSIDLICPICSKGKSTGEADLLELCNTFGECIKSNTRVLVDTNHKGHLGNREIDIYFPKLKFGIEFDHLFTHSEISGGKDKNYHLNKQRLAKIHDIRLIHIWSNEWEEKRDIVKSIILSKLGKYDTRLYARKCVVKEIDSVTKDNFLDSNHLQGKDKSKYKYGLYYNNELVSVMTFGKRNIGKQTSFELIRFANKLNTQVVGGASKLFKYFLRNDWNGDVIKTYADKRYSDGNLYEKLGFTHTHDSNSNYWYHRDSNQLIHRANFMKHKLKDKLETFDNNLTEWENMVNNGYDRIWDCGNKVFEYK